MGAFDNINFSNLTDNPLLQLSMGLLRASGPQKTPHSFGQDLADSYDYMGNQQSGMLKDQYLKAEIAKSQSEADRMKVWQNMFGGGSPLSPQANGAGGGVLSGGAPSATSSFSSNPDIARIAPILGLMSPDKGMEVLASHILPKEAPAGYRTTSDGNLLAIPGGPADLKVQAAKDKDTGVLSSSIADLDRLSSQANDILNAPGLGKNFGMAGMVPNRPGGEAANAQALLDTLKSQTAFNVLQNMRNNSKTGGALGSVSNYEEKMLQDNLAALGKSQSEDQVKQQLQKIITYSNDAKQRARDAFGTKYGDAGAPAQQDLSSQIPASQLQVPDSILRGVQGTPAGQGLLSGSQVPPPSPGIQLNAPAPSAQGQRVIVMSPDGKTGSIDASELQDALKNGWKQVQ